MVSGNQRGQILIESVFLVMIVVSLLIGFQVLIDHQKNQSNKYRISKYKKDLRYDKEKISGFNTKK